MLTFKNMKDFEERLSQMLNSLPAVNPEVLSSLPRQVEVLQSYVFRLSDDIFVFKEVPKQSVQQLDLMFDQLKQLVRGQNKWFLFVDLRGVSVPSADVRVHLRKSYVELAQLGLCFVVLLVGNRVIEFTVKLVGVEGVPVPYYCSHSLSKALQKLLLVRETRQQ